MEGTQPCPTIRPLLIIKAGPTGAGKSTLENTVFESLRIDQKKLLRYPFETGQVDQSTYEPAREETGITPGAIAEALDDNNVLYQISIDDIIEKNPEYIREVKKILTENPTCIERIMAILEKKDREESGIMQGAKEEAFDEVQYLSCISEKFKKAYDSVVSPPQTLPSFQEGEKYCSDPLEITTRITCYDLNDNLLKKYIEEKKNISIEVTGENDINWIFENFFTTEIVKCYDVYLIYSLVKKEVLKRRILSRFKLSLSRFKLSSKDFLSRQSLNAPRFPNIYNLDKKIEVIKNKLISIINRTANYPIERLFVVDNSSDSQKIIYDSNDSNDSNGIIDIIKAFGGKKSKFKQGRKRKTKKKGQRKRKTKKRGQMKVLQSR